MYKFAQFQNLIFELQYGEIMEAEYYSGSDRRMDVINWRHSPVVPRNGTILHLYHNEIVKITAFGATSEEETDGNTPPSLSNKILTIYEDKYNLVQELSRSIISTPVVDVRAKTADLLNSKLIGIALLSTDCEQGGPLEILAAATLSQNILFDIELFTCQRYQDKLKYILESEDIVKVVHDPQNLVECMFRHYGMKVNNIFDTHETALKITGNTMTLQQCLIHFLCIPDVLVNYIFGTELRQQWNRRPLSEDLKYLAIKHVQFLIDLKNCMQSELKKKFQVLTPLPNAVEQATADSFLSLECLDINK